jgi:hypothetical protein
MIIKNYKLQITNDKLQITNDKLQSVCLLSFVFCVCLPISQVRHHVL